MILIIFAVLIIFYILISVVRVFHKIGISRQLITKSQPYTQEGTKSAVIFIGDSTGVGTGSGTNKDSVAGRLGQDYPKVTIDNLSKNGAKVEDILPIIKNLPDKKYELIVIQIGGNNVIHFSNLNTVEANLDESVKVSKEKADNVILITTGNVGLAPFFPWPINTIMSSRSKTLKDAAVDISKKYGAYYVNLYQNKNNDPFAKDPKKYHAIDGLHPSSDGYGIWYQMLKDTLDSNSIKI